ncbi:DUF4440 domain-containing protein [Roseibium sp.]|uniref:DUF4440 domain-containing protein n=1 Tax=Roseibium sp. TaxID=1936156 RepID=UPI003A97FDBD
MSDDGHTGLEPDAEGNGQSAAEEAIAQLFEDYLAGFNDFDADRICDCFTMPATIWQHEKGHVFGDDEELLENIEALLAALDKEGVTNSDFQVVSSHISGAAALVTLDWTQETSDGESALEFTCHYQLILDGDQWMIAMVINE